MPAPPISHENTLGPYRLMHVVGEGAMGTVYLAIDEHLNRKVAVKVLRVAPETARATAMARRFLREAQAAARLNHPNVVTIYTVSKPDAGKAAAPPYIAMEYVDGGSLAQRLRKSGPLHWRDAAAAMRDALLALAEAHRAGIVHRDVKPANLMCARGTRGEEIIKLADFGLARVAAITDGELTFPGAFVGSPSYAAPEQVAGAAQIDGRADLYSLAATGYALLTGQPPFVGDDPGEIMERQLHENFPDVRELASTAPAEFQQFLSHASQKNPAERFQGAQSMLEALEKLLALPASATDTRPEKSKIKNQKSKISSFVPLAQQSVLELESRLAVARQKSDSSTQLDALRSLYGLYAQLDRRDDAVRAFREGLALHVKMHDPHAAARN